MPSLNFTVDSALLRELGERLVGKPHIALAELVKNSYDADATKVIIRLLPDRIEILDNGHGMAKPEFRNFWMRIGTTHKITERVSRNFKRPLTGSKGVGRLAVQFLASELEIRTVSENTEDTEFLGNVDWEKASQAGELTKAKAELYGGAAHRTLPRRLQARHGGNTETPPSGMGRRKHQEPRPRNPVVEAPFPPQPETEDRPPKGVRRERSRPSTRTC